MAGSNYKIYKYIRHVLVKQYPMSIHHDAISAFTNIDKANLFITFFHSTFIASNFSPQAMGDILVPDSTLSSVSFSDADVHDILASLDVSKAMRIGGICPRILKHCAIVALCDPRYHLFSRPLAQYTCSVEWHTNEIIPFF